MRGFNRVDSLQYENTNLKEDLMYYKSRNIDLRTKVQDLEDEMRVLKAKLKKFSATKERANKNYQLGPHFPERLISKKN